MGWIDMHVTLTLYEPECVPQVRLWVDLEPERAFGNELQLALRQVGPDWSGSFHVDERTATAGFIYRLGVFAHRGAHFWLNVRDRERARELLADGDALPASKTMLVGTCPFACSERSAPQQPRLVLLRGGRPAQALSRLPR